MKLWSDRKRPSENPKLEMTPMIDVVFQLLIFFIVTLKQEDILAHLDVSRPAPDPEARQEEQVDDLLQITVYNERKLGGQGVAVQGRQVSFTTLESHLSRLSSYSRNLSIIVKCTGDSYHSNLVKVLDLCSKVGLKNISVFSM